MSQSILLFSSPYFFIFFFVVYVFYLLLSHKNQNLLLLLASYVFYASWDWRFLSLLILTTVMDFYVGRAIYLTPHPRSKKLLLVASLTANLAILGFFKYFNFFSSSLIQLFSLLGLSLPPLAVHVLLPVGISFYTFQTMSYTIDIFRRQLKPSQNIKDFALYVSFFPQLVAGPIERAQNLLPQIAHPRLLTDKNILAGIYLIIWGLFKKIIIADGLAQTVDYVFNAPPPYEALAVLIATYAFAFQIYADFSGYTDIARGLAKLMGFELMLNFNLPYISANPQEFWQRWHISLSSWLKDYLYIPLGGNRHGSLKTLRNLFLTMLLGGLWHGAAWTFVLWGAYHGSLLVAHRLILNANWHLPFSRPSYLLPILKALKVITFFHLICLGWLIFRANSIGQVIAMLQSFVKGFYFSPGQAAITSLSLLIVIPLIIFQILQRWHGQLDFYLKLKPFTIALMILAILFIGSFVSSYTEGVANRPFIYFQF